MPGPISETLTHVVDQLTAGGITATTDPRDLNLTGVWVTLTRIASARFAGGIVTLDVGLTAIAADSGAAGTLSDLDELVLALDAIYPHQTWEPRSVVVASQSPTHLPALHTTITLEWSN